MTNGNGKEGLSREARDVSALAQAFQKMAEQAKTLADSGESNAIRCIAAGEALAYTMAAKRIREVISPTVARPIEINTEALTLIFDTHIKMLEGLLATELQEEIES
jgi:hypothetical protein